MNKTGIAYICFPDKVLDYKWINYFADQTDKYEVVVIGPASEPVSHTVSNNITCYSILPEYYPIKNIFEQRRILKLLQEKLSNHHIDFYHALYALPNAIWARRLASEAKKPYFLSTRGSDVMVQLDAPNNGINDYLLKRTYFKSFKKAKAISSTSYGQKNKIKEVLNLESTVIRTGIDLGLWFDTTSKFTRNDDVFTFFSPRLSSDFYNTNIILDAFIKCVKMFPSMNFQLKLLNYFDAKYDHDLMDKAKAEGVGDKVIFLGRQEFEGMASNYVDSHVVISIPNSDGTPNSVLEAMLTKRPTIIGPLDYDRDLFNENTTWMIESFTTKALLKQMAHIIESDYALVEKKVNHAFQNAKEKVDLSIQHQLLEEMYKKINL